MFIKKLIVFILFCLVLSSVYTPNLAFSQEFTSDEMNPEFVEIVEKTDIFNQEQEIVGELQPGTQLKVGAIQEGIVYFQWNGEMAYIEEKSTKIVAAENITGGNQEGIVTSEDAESLSPIYEQDKNHVESKSISQNLEPAAAEAPTSAPAPAAEEKPTIQYSTHIQDIGWQNEVSDGKVSGTEGKAKRLEGIKISVKNVEGLGVKYSTHVQDYGWLSFVSDGKVSGTTGKAKRLEAIKMELTGSKAGNYDIYYRVHAETYGWMDWAKNGQLAGTSGEAKRLEAIEIIIVSKGSKPPTNNEPYVPEEPVNKELSVTYKSYVQTDGWLESVANGALSGTVDQFKKIEALQISLNNTPYTGGISYKTHVQDYGWLPSVSDGNTSGIPGKDKRVESIQMQLLGEMANHYDVYYRVYQQSFGWLSWVKNGESAGKVGMAKQVEALEVVLVEKGGKAPGSNRTEPSTVYSTHVETYGWMNFVKNGVMSGTSGQAKRLEAIQIKIENAPYSGEVIYSTHVQDYGWLNNVSNGGVSGTTGKSKRLEAIKINLTGEIANYYDVYYRVHIEAFGWLGWAKNGMDAGSQGQSKRLEAIEIKLVAKGQGVPVSAQAAFKKPITVFLDPGHGGSDPGAVAGKYHEADLNLAVAKKVQSLLLNNGYQVHMSRNNDTYIGLIDRPKMANELFADIFVSIHTNSTGAGETNATGIESYYYEFDPSYPSKINQDMHNNADRIKKSVTLTNLIQENMISYSGANDRGTDGETFAVIREAAMPATLLEMGFINNTNDRRRLFTDSYQNQLAKAIADGIHEYFQIYK